MAASFIRWRVNGRTSDWVTHSKWESKTTCYTNLRYCRQTPICGSSRWKFCLLSESSEWSAALPDKLLCLFGGGSSSPVSAIQNMNILGEEWSLHWHYQYDIAYVNDISHSGANYARSGNQIAFSETAKLDEKCDLRRTDYLLSRQYPVFEAKGGLEGFIFSFSQSHDKCKSKTLLLAWFAIDSQFYFDQWYILGRN